MAASICYTFAILVMLVLVAFPDIELSRQLRTVLVEYPASQMQKLRRVHLLLLLFFLMFLPVAGQLIFVAGSVDILLIYVSYAAIYTDVLLAGATIAATMKLHVGLDWFRGTKMGAMLRRR